MDCKLISLSLGFSLSFVLASAVAVMVMAVMAVVVTASIVVAAVVSLRCFRRTMASWPCILDLVRCALIMTMHFLAGTGRRRRFSG